MVASLGRLHKVIELVESPLRSLGCELRPNRAGGSLTGTGVDIGSAAFVGTVSHWPPDVFEFQFNDCTTGEAVLLETREFESDEAAAEYLKQIVDNLARRTSGV